MAFRVKPDFSAVWASLGDNTKPVDSYITNGWESVKPPRQYFNWLDNRQDSAIAYLYQSGIPEWDALTDYEGGAGVNSYTQGSDGKVYRCLADNGPNVVSIGAKDPTNPLNSAFWTVAFVEKSAFDSLASTVATHTTQIGNGSGVTGPAAWRTALSVDSSAQVNAKIASATALGVNQTWQNVTGSRAGNITYFNNTSAPIMVVLSHSTFLSASVYFTIDGHSFMWAHAGSTIGVSGSLSIVVPVGSSYSTNYAPTMWLELRA